MKLSSPWFYASRASVWVSVALACLFTAGCEQVFVPKHRVLVDAITAPGVTKPPGGTSYRLVAKRSMVSNLPVQISVLKACVDAALVSQGLYEAPANTPSEIVIEISCGRDASARALASVRETYLQLVARSNPQGALERGTGPELWDVRVAVLGLSGSIETALPLLSAVAAEHMAANTGIETRVEVPQKSPAVEAVRAAAIKVLEAQAQRMAAAPGSGASVQVKSAPRAQGALAPTAAPQPTQAEMNSKPPQTRVSTLPSATGTPVQPAGAANSEPAVAPR